jgi:CheY-like chemotaxis protein
VSGRAKSAVRLANVVPSTPASILVVDDEPDVRQVVAEFLQEVGYHVVQAESGAAALDALRTDDGINLLITDIRMPDMSGVELADHAAVQFPLLKIILISGYTVTHQLRRRFLRKPFRMRELVAAVRAELGEE